jgi:hypothetical protein
LTPSSEPQYTPRIVLAPELVVVQNGLPLWPLEPSLSIVRSPFENVPELGALSGLVCVYIQPPQILLALGDALHVCDVTFPHSRSGPQG